MKTEIACITLVIGTLLGAMLLVSAPVVWGSVYEWFYADLDFTNIGLGMSCFLGAFAQFSVGVLMSAFGVSALIARVEDAQ